MVTRYKWVARVLSVQEHKATVWKGGVGDAAVMEEVSVGWFARVTESSAIFLGFEKPDIQPGDEVELTMTRRPRPGEALP